MPFLVCMAAYSFRCLSPGLSEECRKNQQQKPRGEKRLVSAVEIYKGKVWAIDKNCSSIEAKNRKTKKFKKFEKN